ARGEEAQGRLRSAEQVADCLGEASLTEDRWCVVGRYGQHTSAESGASATARLMDAILVSSIDHGATPPSALAARTVASTGATLSAAVAAGIMSINRHHGGEIEDGARQLKVIADRATGESISLDEAATRRLAAMREAGERMPG